MTDSRRCDAPDGRVPGGLRPNIVAKVSGKHPAPTVWVCAHLDVVPAGDLGQWNSDPFRLTVAGDKVYGRGTEDNHQAVVSGLLAVKALRELNIPPLHDVGLVIVSDEETGSEYGLGYLLKNHQDIFRPGDWFIVPDAGDPQGIGKERLLAQISSEGQAMSRLNAGAGRQRHARGCAFDR